MRILGLICFFAASLQLWAQESFLGTKADVVKSSSTSGATPPSLLPLLQIVLVAGIVLFALKAIAPKFINKLNRRLVTGIGGGIHIEQSASFAGGNLYIVSARNKTLLLSVGANGVQCLSDLTEPTAMQDPPLFMDLVDHAVVARAEDDAPPAPSTELEIDFDDQTACETEETAADRNPTISWVPQGQPTIWADPPPQVEAVIEVPASQTIQWIPREQSLHRPEATTPLERLNRFLP